MTTMVGAAEMSSLSVMSAYLPRSRIEATIVATCGPRTERTTSRATESSAPLPAKSSTTDFPWASTALPRAEPGWVVAFGAATGVAGATGLAGATCLAGAFAAGTVTTGFAGACAFAGVWAFAGVCGFGATDLAGAVGLAGVAGFAAPAP